MGSYTQQETLNEANPEYLKRIKTQQLYLVLRIQITYQNCIPGIEDQVRPFPIKIRISHRTTWTRGPNWTNPTGHSIAFATTISTNKTKRPASITSS